MGQNYAVLLAVCFYEPICFCLFRVVRVSHRESLYPRSLDPISAVFYNVALNLKSVSPECGGDRRRRRT